MALLRGINVGGRNRILMADLSASFESAGYEDVRTYIQSGNVVFASDEPERETLRAAIEQMLADAFDYAATVELHDRAELQAVVEAAPAGFGDDKDAYRYDVLFLLPPFQPNDALEALTGRCGVDRAGRGVRLTGLCAGLEERPLEDRLASVLPAHDHPQLEHDHQAAVADEEQLRNLRSRPPVRADGSSSLLAIG